jgi:hypothetical protein
LCVIPIYKRCIMYACRAMRVHRIEVMAVMYHSLRFDCMMKTGGLISKSNWRDSAMKWHGYMVYSFIFFCLEVEGILFYFSLAPDEMLNRLNCFISFLTLYVDLDWEFKMIKKDLLSQRHSSNSFRFQLRNFEWFYKTDNCQWHALNAFAVSNQNCIL